MTLQEAYKIIKQALDFYEDYAPHQNENFTQAVKVLEDFIGYQNEVAETHHIDGDSVFDVYVGALKTAIAFVDKAWQDDEPRGCANYELAEEDNSEGI